MRDAMRLDALLRDLEGRGYGAWKRLRGTWSVAGDEIEVVRVQPDPFAPPSRLEVRCGPERLGLPRELVATGARRRAVADHLLRLVAAGLTPPLVIDVGGQQVLERSAAEVDDDGALTLRLAVSLPDRRRRVRTATVARALLTDLPAALDSLHWDRLDRRAAWEVVATVEDAATLRERLDELGLVAFVADGSVLARRSGVDDRPAQPAVPFVAPAGLRIEVELAHRGRVTGMGVAAGVSVVVGGGFHGKSTLLTALRAGVYDHLPGDGRELVVTRGDAVTVRAEDGRRVEQVDLSTFIDAVPSPVALATGQGPATLDTSAFSSDDASGSTSQAAAIIEAIEVGTGLLLVDEDTAATNLMARDRRMEALISSSSSGDAPVPRDPGDGPAGEPITPLVDLVRSLASDRGVSTVLVAGSGGDYLEVADRVVHMDAFTAHEATATAGEVVATVPGRPPADDIFPPVPGRVVDPVSVDARRRGKVRTKVVAGDRIAFGEHELDLRALEQMVDVGQLAGIAAALVRLVDDGHLDGRTTLREAVEALDAAIDAGGLDVLLVSWPGDLARPRAVDVAAAVNRLRTLRVRTMTRP